MKFNQNSLLNSYWFGTVSALIVAFIVTTIIIAANAKDFSVMEHYRYFIDPSEISPIFRSSIRARVLLSIKGGGIVLLPLFFLFLNKKMYKAVKGLMGFVFVLVLIAVIGYFMQK